MEVPIYADTLLPHRGINGPNAGAATTTNHPGRITTVGEGIRDIATTTTTTTTTGKGYIKWTIAEIHRGTSTLKTNKRGAVEGIYLRHRITNPQTIKTNKHEAVGETHLEH